VTARRVLDLSCGAGGCSMGYHRAGLEVVGVDRARQPRYPFEFLRMDALVALRALDLSQFDAIHASPPCQLHSVSTTRHRREGREYVNMIPETRAALEASGLPYVIENVPGAPIRDDFRICGCHVGLDLRRVRLFETNWSGLRQAPPCYHTEPVVSVVGHGMPTWARGRLGYKPTIQDYQRAMGIDWMNRDELSLAVPPAYTERVGRALSAWLEERGSQVRIRRPSSEAVA
jgi:DNA (cytosine-5)-methyltransferase 1